MVTAVNCIAETGRLPQVSHNQVQCVKRGAVEKEKIMQTRVVREIMTPNPVVLMADTPIREAAKTMRDRNIGDVIVQKDGHICGIVTDRDIVIRAIAQDGNPSNTPLESICSSQITALSPDDSDDKAVQLMKEKSVRRLPVVEGQKVVGVVSLGDLAVKRDPVSALGKISSARPNR
jgi:CBS domain-containing protein